MIPRYLPIFIAPYTILLALPASARAQDGCRADSVSTARAESLLTNISDEVANPGSRGIRSMYARVRRAVEVAPLSHTRWKRILQATRLERRRSIGKCWNSGPSRRGPSFDSAYLSNVGGRRSTGRRRCLLIRIGALRSYGGRPFPALLLPNMRLKLAGARGGGIALPRQLAFLSAVLPPCASVPFARSLSAIR